jgi:hypothetical protein
MISRLMPATAGGFIFIIVGASQSNKLLVVENQRPGWDSRVKRYHAGPGPLGWLVWRSGARRTWAGLPLCRSVLTGRLTPQRLEGCPYHRAARLRPVHQTHPNSNGSLGMTLLTRLARTIVLPSEPGKVHQCWEAGGYGRAVASVQQGWHKFKLACR